MKERIKDKLRNWWMPSIEEETFNTTMKYVSFNKLKGDYAEFGVWQGKSFIQAYKYAKHHHLKSMKFLAFDSFQGLPFNEGTFKKGQYKCSLSRFKTNIQEKVNLKEVTIIKGWFKNTFQSFRPSNKIIVALIDCDLTESTKQVLNYLTPFIQKGTVIIFDDWFANDKIKRIFKVWQKEYGIQTEQYRKFGWRINSFIIRKHKDTKKDVKK